MAHVIDPKRCDGCGSCAEGCPMEAVVAEETGRWRIDPALCTDCGECLDVCPADAVRGS